MSNELEIALSLLQTNGSVYIVPPVLEGGGYWHTSFRIFHEGEEEELKSSIEFNLKLIEEEGEGRLFITSIFDSIPFEDIY